MMFLPTDWTLALALAVVAELERARVAELAAKSRRYVVANTVCLAANLASLSWSVLRMNVVLVAVATLGVAAAIHGLGSARRIRPATAGNAAYVNHVSHHPGGPRVGPLRRRRPARPHLH